MEVKAGDFVEVIVKSLEDHGIKEGDYLYLAGDTFVPETPDDPYLFRKVFIAARVIDYHIQADDKPFLVDGKSTTLVDESEKVRLQTVYEEDFKGGE